MLLQMATRRTLLVKIRARENEGFNVIDSEKKEFCDGPLLAF